MKHLLILLSILLLSSPLFGQSGKPQTIIIPTGSLGEISEIRKKMLEKTLESKLDDYFAIVPKELFEEAQEQAFQEMDADECTEEQCIMMIREILQVENSFQMVLMEEEGDTQISLTWNDLDKKRVEEEYCEGCKTKQLRKMIEGLVEKLVGVKEVEPVVEVKKVEKVNESGTKQWTKQLGTSSDDWGNGVSTDSSGNIYVTGYTYGGLDGNTNSYASRTDIFLVKYNSSGTKQWTKQLGTSSGDYGNDVTTDSSGNIYVTGSTWGGLDGNTNSGSYDIFIVKYNSSGIKQ